MSGTVTTGQRLGLHHSLPLVLPGIGLAAVWIGANLLFPDLVPSGIPSLITRLTIHGAILFGLWRSLVSAGVALKRRTAIWFAVALPFSLWLAVIWAAAINGAFQPLPGIARLPRLPVAIFLPLVICAPMLLRSRTVATILDAMPTAWLIALQVYRVFGGIFLVNWVHGAASGFFAWPAAVGDMITGIMALPVARAVASGTIQGHRTGLLWNIFGLIDFAVAITVGVLSTPGPLQQFGFEIPLSQVGTYPTVMIPAFAVPSSILLHVLSIRQLRRRSGTVHASSNVATAEAAPAA
jgi:hypothetical protein